MVKAMFYKTFTTKPYKTIIGKIVSISRDRYGFDDFVDILDDKGKHYCCANDGSDYFRLDFIY